MKQFCAIAIFLLLATLASGADKIPAGYTTSGGGPGPVTAADVLSALGNIESAGSVTAGTLIYGTTGFQSTGDGVAGSTAGNSRGTGAVDLQTNRSSATQVATGAQSVIGGGRRNTAVGTYDAVLSGDTNYVKRSEVLGTEIGSDAPSVIAGGARNYCFNYAAGVFSGKDNVTSGAASVIVGGSSNEIANAPHATIAGGVNNAILFGGDGSFIGSGSTNTASGNYSSIIGGYNNTASGDYSTVGGTGNTAGGDSATALGGNVHATGDYSIALGRAARALHSGSFVFGDATTTGYVDTTATDQFIAQAAGGIYFEGPVVVNETGADVDSRIEGDTDANLLYIDAGNDRVAVGLAAPEKKFHVKGDSLFSGAISALVHLRDEDNAADAKVFSLLDSGGSLYIVSRNDDFSAKLTLVQVDGTGNVLPGTTNAQDLGSGTKEWQDIFLINAPTVSSVRRLKENLRPIGDGESDALSALVPKAYTRETSATIEHYGFVAEDLEAALIANGRDPRTCGALTYGRDGNLIGIRYGELIPLLWRRMQRQKEIIQAQQAQIDQLVTYVQNLNQRVTALEGAASAGSNPGTALVMH